MDQDFFIDFKQRGTVYSMIIKVKTFELNIFDDKPRTFDEFYQFIRADSSEGTIEFNNGCVLKRYYNKITISLKTDFTLCYFDLNVHDIHDVFVTAIKKAKKIGILG